jgi:predicted MFS family arabinose efflux permease
VKPKLELDTPMTREELRASVSLAGIYMFRMLGLFMILPVFSVYARDLPDSTPFLIGLAISAYGLTQAVLQIPFGRWSDRYGRKPLITIGLLLFAAGSVLAAVSDSIYGIVAGRALQGAGAVAGVVMALAADLTREEHRTKAMALIGISIGLSFALSMVAGPILSGWVGVPGLFWIIAGLAGLSLLLLFFAVPAPAVSRFHRDAQPQSGDLGKVLADPELLRLDLGIFSLHLILTATFIALPLVLRDHAQLEVSEHWKVYLPVFAISLVGMVPFIILAEKKRLMKQVFVGFVGLLAVAEFALFRLNDQVLVIGSVLAVFFIAFNLLEATLPSMVSKAAPATMKGTAMGAYTTAQFLGSFIGGIGGGWVYGRYGAVYVFLACGIVAVLWCVLAFTMKPPKYVSNLLIRVGNLPNGEATQLSRRLLGVPGVTEAVVLGDDGVAYLKIERDRLDRDMLLDLLPIPVSEG